MGSKKRKNPTKAAQQANINVTKSTPQQTANAPSKNVPQCITAAREPDALLSDFCKLACMPAYTCKVQGQRRPSGHGEWSPFTVTIRCGNRELVATFPKYVRQKTVAVRHARYLMFKGFYPQFELPAETKKYDSFKSVPVPLADFVKQVEEFRAEKVEARDKLLYDIEGNVSDDDEREYKLELTTKTYEMYAKDDFLIPPLEKFTLTETQDNPEFHGVMTARDSIHHFTTACQMFNLESKFSFSEDRSGEGDNHRLICKVDIHKAAETEDKPATPIFSFENSIEIAKQSYKELLEGLKDQNFELGHVFEKEKALKLFTCEKLVDKLVADKIMPTKEAPFHIQSERRAALRKAALALNDENNVRTAAARKAKRQAAHAAMLLSHQKAKQAKTAQKQQIFNQQPPKRKAVNAAANQTQSSKQAAVARMTTTQLMEHQQQQMELMAKKHQEMMALMGKQ